MTRLYNSPSFRMDKIKAEIEGHPPESAVPYLMAVIETLLPGADEIANLQMRHRIQPQQAAILAKLIRHNGKPVPYDALLLAAGNIVDDDGGVSRETLRVQLTGLRKAIAKTGAHIETVYGHGLALKNWPEDAA